MKGKIKKKFDRETCTGMQGISFIFFFPQFPARSQFTRSGYTRGGGGYSFFFFGSGMLCDWTSTIPVL